MKPKFKCAGGCGNLVYKKGAWCNSLCYDVWKANNKEELNKL